jgi:hypothetical protein
MAGLLDFLETPAGQGLLAATFAGLAGARRGAPMNTLGAAGLGGLAGYSNALNMNQDRQRQDIQNKMLAMQMQQLERARADEEAQQQAFKLMTQAGRPTIQGTNQVGGMLADQMAGFEPQEALAHLAGSTPEGIGQGGTGYNMAGPYQMPKLSENWAGLTAGPDPNAMRQLQENPYYQKMAATYQMKQMFAEPDYKVVGNSLVQVGPGGAKSVFDAPQEQKQTELARLIAERNALPPGHPAISTYDAAIKKATTHQPASQATAVSYGTPLPVVNTVTGKTEIIQPTKQGEPPKVLEGYTTPEAAKDQAKATERTNLANIKANIILGKVDEALKQTKPTTTGLVGAAASKIPGTEAYDLRETVRTIQANIGFQELQQMREASPTGGALGQVAVQELESLQATLASLNPNQSEAQLRNNLKKVDKHYRNWLNAVNKANNQGAKQGGLSPAGQSAFEKYRSR